MSPLRGALAATFRPGSHGVRVEVATNSPLELRGPFHADVPRYFLRNVTAGILDGDEYEVSLRVESHARVEVRPSAAQKVFTMQHAGARLRQRIEVLPGALLRYSNGVTILQRASRFAQETELVVHPGALLTYLEVTALGRLASGERLAFDRYEAALHVRDAAGVLHYAERADLHPAASEEARASLAAAVGGAGVFGSLFILGALDHEPLLVSVEADESSEVYAGASLLPDEAGVVVRALAPRAESVVRLLERVARSASLPPLPGGEGGGEGASAEFTANGRGASAPAHVAL